MKKPGKEERLENQKLSEIMKERVDSDYEEGWTKELLLWLLAWLDLIMEREENKKALEDIKK